jgi:chromosome segregation ATPase
MEDLAKRLEAAVKRRNDIEAAVRRTEGKLEAARTSLQAVEQECRDKGLDPDHIDDAVSKLEKAANTAIEKLELDLAAAEAALQPYLTE